MGARRQRVRAAFVAFVVVVVAAAVVTGPSAAAVQPGSIEDQIAEADADLKAAQVQLADTYEAFSAADKRYRDLSAAVAAAQGKVARTRAEADAATARERDARLEFDEFAAASYRDGIAVFSARAYVGSRSPDDLLDRASLLTALAGENGEVMDATRAAVDAKAEADREARAALDEVKRNRDAATSARATAEQAYNAAVALQDEAKAELTRLADRRATLAARSSGSDDTSGSRVVSAAGAVVRPAQGRLTSTYGARWGTIHYGIDIANSIGTPILSAMAGEVIDSGPASGVGLWVRVRHDGGLVTVYGHINESLVSVGQSVAAGEQIATMGNRGQSTGPHLHFEVHQDGSKIDPLPWLRSRGVAL